VADCVADTAHGCTVQPNTAGCLTTDATCTELTCQGGDPFVRRTGQTLRLHDEPYRFVGVNNWGIAWDADGCKIGEFATQDAALARMFDDLVAMKVSVARLWAFQSFAGSTGRDYSSFDNVVHYARRANIRLVLVLENMWADGCTPGERRDDAWFATGYLAPYSNYALSYSDYVLGLVNHFKDEPTILAWELMHEAGAEDFVALDGFVSQMSALIRKNDPNHLIASGVGGGDTAATNQAGNPSNFYALHAHTTVDLIDHHDFNNPDVAFTEDEQTTLNIAQLLNKPLFFGALGIPVANSTVAFELRATQAKAKFDAAFENGFVGALMYDYYPDWTTTSASATTLSFDSRASDPIGGPTGVIAQAATRFNSP
jgi:mannan endo-1,4-beta-mannosidase